MAHDGDDATGLPRLCPMSDTLKEHATDGRCAKLVRDADMSDFIRDFWADEEGAVTVEWVVMAAMICGIGFALVVAVRTGAGSLAAGAQSHISTSASSIRN